MVAPSRTRMRARILMLWPLEKWAVVRVARPEQRIYQLPNGKGLQERLQRLDGLLGLLPGAGRTKIRGSILHNSHTVVILNYLVSVGVHQGVDVTVVHA